MFDVCASRDAASEKVKFKILYLEKVGQGHKGGNGTYARSIANV